MNPEEPDVHDPMSSWQRESDTPLDPRTKAVVDVVAPPDAGPYFWASLNHRLDQVDAERPASNDNYSDGGVNPIDQHPRQINIGDPDVGRPGHQGIVISPDVGVATREVRSGRGRYLLVAAAAAALVAVGFLMMVGDGLNDVQPAEDVVSTSTTLAEGEGVTPTSDASPSSPSLSPPEPDVLQAEDMATKTEGEPGNDGTWFVWRNGFVANDVYFPQSADYEFVVVARGYFSSHAPSVDVRIDFVSAAEPVEVAKDIFAEYRFIATVEEGTHEVAIANVVLSKALEDPQLGTTVLVVDRIEIRPIQD